MFKKMLSTFVDHPFLTSLFISDLLILVFHKPPFLFSVLMLGLLSGLCLYLGQKMALAE